MVKSKRLNGREWYEKHLSRIAAEEAECLKVEDGDEPVGYNNHDNSCRAGAQGERLKRRDAVCTEAVCGIVA